MLPIFWNRPYAMKGTGVPVANVVIIPPPYTLAGQKAELALEPTPSMEPEAAASAKYSYVK